MLALAWYPDTGRVILMSTKARPDKTNPIGWELLWAFYGKRLLSATYNSNELTIEPDELRRIGMAGYLKINDTLSSMMAVAVSAHRE